MIASKSFICVSDDTQQRNKLTKQLVDHIKSEIFLKKNVRRYHFTELRHSTLTFLQKSETKLMQVVVLTEYEKSGGAL